MPGGPRSFSAAQFVDIAYRGLLSRVPDPPAAAAFVPAIEGGTLSPERLISTILESEEFKASVHSV